MIRGLTPALAAAAALVAGCGGKLPTSGTYERCVHDGGPDQVRTGSVQAYGTDFDWGSRARNGLFTITKTRTDCMVTVKVTGPDGTTYENGPFRWVLYARARPDPPALAYLAGLPDSKVAIVLNGRVGPSFDNSVFEPRFSNNGRHLAYVARRGDTEIVVVDGAEQMRHHAIERVFELHGELHMSSFGVLDDGRAVVFAEEQGKLRAYVGGEPLEPTFDHIPEQSVKKSPDGSHYAFRARHGARRVLVVDGEIVDHPGIPVKIEWSADGHGYAFVVRRARIIPSVGETSPPAEGYVLDGKFVPFAGARQIRHEKGHWLLWTENPRTLVVLGVPTPQAPPTEDDYKPVGSRASYAIRVRIGESLGPVFEEIETKSIRIEKGVVRYRGKRKDAWLDVVNNVIERNESQTVASDEDDAQNGDAQSGDAQNGDAQNGDAQK